MFETDAEGDAYARIYESDLIDHLTKMVATVDSEIKRALARAENPVQGNNRVERQAIEQASLLQKKLLEDPEGFISKDRAASLKPSGADGAPASTAPEMTDLQKEQLYRRIDQLEQKIDFFVSSAQQQGEEGNIDESEKIMLEVENLRAQKKALEDKLTGKEDVKGEDDEDMAGDAAFQDDAARQQEKPDRNMKVCEVCGALQSVADTEDRLQMHFEGKKHKGYLLIRAKLDILSKKRQEDRQRGLDRKQPLNRGSREA